MRYPILLVADPHFTSNARDEYRWAFWPWLRAQCKEHGIRTVCFLGDLSDAKDFHPSSLVNRLAFEVSETAKLARLYFIPGNHEWLKQGEEFWRFLSLTGENIHYFTRPSDDPVPHQDGPIVRFLPFTKTPVRDWAGQNFEDYDFVFMHQTVSGSRASNGQEMDGEDVPFQALMQAGFVYSGDIHVPQKIGARFEYVGSPYHVHFGDSFVPRCVLLRSFKDREDLHFKSPRRVTLDVGTSYERRPDVDKGDQVKLRVTLSASERHEWKAVRRGWLEYMKEAGVEVHGIEMLVEKAGRRRLSGSVQRISSRARPQDDVFSYVTREELGSDALDAAMEVIEQ